jgi:aminoglycoside/choline kinase family phosphotransferase
MPQLPKIPASEQFSLRESQLQQWAERALAEGNFIGGDDHAMAFSIVSGDASFRRYFRLAVDGQTFIAVDAPPDHEDSASFIHVDELFLSAGVRVPKIYAVDLDLGFMLLEDFGDETYLPTLLKAQSSQDSTSSNKLYADAIDALVMLQKGADKERLDPYSQKELRREMNLFPEWMCEKFLGIALDAETREFIDSTFEFLEDAALSQPTVAVHRDYHSRNLLVLNSGGGPGVIDFQDAVCGPYTYDLVSLLRDCYIVWPQSRIDDWARYYLESALKSGIVSGTTPTQLARDFDLMGLQRHLKVMGIFCRLCLRDNKSAYLADIPLVIQYFLDVGQRYPEIGAFLTWFRTEVLPRAREKLTLHL